ncbi:RagB/SusD family nutrient uptake outer membrane protein [Proteiniphilum propionicum]|uniref:RagB/SusD family nutrient uptake outer membrane protein n=1 Tax=Proteiniphilum propionicum TaxID=2829812 RepID=UPI001EEC0040|nr:RagB/SusD family nutrient uptake outer membrane protein [Proteiniphilum propionicum]ULB34878.1 RagB/SusD family nutrient uptake outer membrane protein [Proteiniphilum propionicum]
MKKIFRELLYMGTAVIILSSCSEWLDLTPTDQLTDKVVWEKESSVDLYVNGFYTYLNQYGQFGTAQAAGNLTESLTSTFKYGSYALGHKAGHANNYVFNPSTVTPASCFYSNWDDAYNKIRRMNEFLHSMRQYGNFSEEINKRWEAQVLFFRAFIYFQLAKRHDGVILYTSIEEMQKDKARSSNEDTWDLIESDLDFAIANLPESLTGSNQGRLTKFAALAFKSRAMLYAKRWQSAYDAADAVVKSNKFGLVDDYAQSWKGSNEESILEFRYDELGPNHTFDKDYVPLSDGYEFGGLGTPTQEMVESYEKADGTKMSWTAYYTKNATRPPYEELEPRFKATIIYPGSTWKGNVMQNSVNGTNGTFMAYRAQPYTYGHTTTGYFLRKLMDENLIDVKGKPSKQTWVEIRYSEVLLNLAEAAFRLNKINEARSAMNEVRERVNLPAKNSSGNEWFNDYRNERKVELAYEGHLFWDMRRWELAHIEYNNYRCHGFKITGDNYEYIDVDYQDRKFSAKNYILPIPDEELANNSLIEQYDSWK